MADPTEEQEQAGPTIQIPAGANFALVFWDPETGRSGYESNVTTMLELYGLMETGKRMAEARASQNRMVKGVRMGLDGTAPGRLKA